MKGIFFQEERRRQAVLAAEQRAKASDSRGLSDPEGYQKKVAKREEMEREAQNANTGGGLKVRYM